MFLIFIKKSTQYCFVSIPYVYVNFNEWNRKHIDVITSDLDNRIIPSGFYLEIKTLEKFG